MQQQRKQVNFFRPFPPRPAAPWHGWLRKAAWLVLLLGIGLSAAAQQPALQALEFLHDVALTAQAAPDASGPGQVVYAIGAPGKSGGRPALRAQLQLPATIDSLSIRVVASHAGLGTATRTVAAGAGPRTLELEFQPTGAAPATEATDLVLRWEYKTGPGPWTSFAATRHRLYWVLQTPGSPWAGLRAAEGGAALWTAALEISCRAAAGARTAEEAARAVTQFVYGSRVGENGPTKFQYNPMLPDANLTHLDEAAAHYVVRTEDLQALLTSLNNPAMTHLQLNCYDAAGCVVMLSNALGCTLKRVKVNSAYYLVTRKLVPMGYTKPAKADFRVHCVAWSGPLDERGLVYDACFALPSATEGVPGKPLASLAFGSSRQPGSYAEQVFTNKEDFYLTPLPALIIRKQAAP